MARSDDAVSPISHRSQIWREKTDGSGGFEEEEKLEGHSDWVRDVAWAPSIGLPKTVIASCSQDQRVIIWTHDGSPGAQWSSKVGVVGDEDEGEDDSDLFIRTLHFSFDSISKLSCCTSFPT